MSSTPSSTALTRRSAERRRTMTVIMGRMGEEPEVDEATLKMTMGERMELACLLSQTGYAFQEAFQKATGVRSAKRLPRHAWPARLVRG